MPPHRIAIAESLPSVIIVRITNTTKYATAKRVNRAAINFDLLIFISASKTIRHKIVALHFRLGWGVISITIIITLAGKEP